jgi:predicted TIM-barrel fold metal-dependent hydrolase
MLKAAPRLRGIRMQLHWHENPLFRFARRPDLCDDETVRRNLRRLAERGLLFELQVFAPQMRSAANLATALPELQFVLLHAGMLEDTSPAGIAVWREGMDALADCPNVAVKLSGLGTFSHRVDRDFIGFVVSETIERFGAERCLFGSNFPIEKLWTDYAALIAAYRAVLAPFPEEERQAIFSDTARRIYRLD